MREKENGNAWCFRRKKCVLIYDYTDLIIIYGMDDILCFIKSAMISNINNNNLTVNANLLEIKMLIDFPVD